MRQLYTDVKFPVSKGTTKISQFMKWDHSTSWFVPYWMHKDYVGKVVEVDMSDENNAYLFGHDLDGRVLMPATGYLVSRKTTNIYLSRSRSCYSLLFPSNNLNLKSLKSQ